MYGNFQSSFRVMDKVELFTRLFIVQSLHVKNLHRG